MYDKLTDKTRQVISYARQDEAAAERWHDLYDRTMAAFRAVCEGLS